MNDESSDRPGTSPVSAGMRGRCPRCGKGALFAGLSLAVRERCSQCSLEFSFIDPGDGPAVFAIMLLGFIMLGAALILEFKAEPPLWVHVAVWTPATILLAFGLLRPLKGLLIALQYHNKAGPGRAG